MEYGRANIKKALFDKDKVSRPVYSHNTDHPPSCLSLIFYMDSVANGDFPWRRVFVKTLRIPSGKPYEPQSLSERTYHDVACGTNRG